MPMRLPAVTIVWRGETVRLKRLEARLLAQTLSLAPAGEPHNLARCLQLALSARAEVELPLFGADVVDLVDALRVLVERGVGTPGIAALARLVAAEETLERRNDPGLSGRSGTTAAPA